MKFDSLVCLCTNVLMANDHDLQGCTKPQGEWSLCNNTFSGALKDVAYGTDSMRKAPYLMLSIINDTGQ